MPCIVNIILKRRRGIGQYKQDNKIFEEAIANLERSFWLLAILNSQAIKSGNNVDFLKILALQTLSYIFMINNKE